MKIKCSYCGAYFDDTMTECPHCGALNEGVVRTTASQPLTIEELAKWYKDRGLPSYETTRFFIGENHKGPRAFGIYKDKKGNFVVYKNKDSGERAIRYEGTDEAYAVNEIFQRLKQEIIEQKKNQVKKGKTGNAAKASSKSLPKMRRPSGCLIALLTPAALLVLISLISGVYILVKDLPAKGYYYCNDSYLYYTNDSDELDDSWILYNEEDDTWIWQSKAKDAPEELQKNKTAKKYFISESWNKNLGCSNFLKSDEFKKLQMAGKVESGYYRIDKSNYYHYSEDSDEDWYEYDDDDDKWVPVEYTEIPEELTEYYAAQDFYYVPVWDSETQITDFTDSEYYSSSSSGSSSSSDSFWDNYDDDSDYDWDSGSDSWDSGSSDWDSDW